MSQNKKIGHVKEFGKVMYKTMSRRLKTAEDSIKKFNKILNSTIHRHIIRIHFSFWELRSAKTRKFCFANVTAYDFTSHEFIQGASFNTFLYIIQL